jgi:hypothetical protein
VFITNDLVWGIKWLPSICFTAVKQNKPNPQAAESKLRGLTSLNQDEYDVLLVQFDLLVSQKLSHYTLKGNKRLAPRYREAINSSLYGSEKKLDFILMYMKENPNQLYQAQLFDISQSKVSEWVSFLLPVLEQSLAKLALVPQSGYKYAHQDTKTDYLLVDVTERQVGRRENYAGQEEEYSGKKKLHTIKNLAITDPEGYLLYISPSFEGSTHDKTIWEQLQIKSSQINWLTDLGFLGIDKDYPNVILPFKKPKKAELTELQKKINKALSSCRVRIEHAFSGVKRLKIIRNKIRLKSYEARDQVMLIATALHNLRLKFRNC